MYLAPCASTRRLLGSASSASSARAVAQCTQDSKREELQWKKSGSGNGEAGPLLSRPRPSFNRTGYTGRLGGVLKRDVFSTTAHRAPRPHQLLRENARPIKRDALARMRDIMTKLKLTVNETKTRVCKLPKEKFDFLGHTLGRCDSSKTGRAYLGTVPRRSG
jgi:hypothetical protein